MLTVIGVVLMAIGWLMAIGTGRAAVCEGALVVVTGMLFSLILLTAGVILIGGGQ